jgi:uncharacterized protein with von Willebrand factor type A (vWA) domain
LFHTRLVHIADALRKRHPGVAMARLSLMADGFSGGARIATALKSFNDRYTKETLDRRTIVIVMSDGYDTDSPDALAVELRLLTALRPPTRWRAWQRSKANWRGSDRGLTRLLLFPFRNRKFDRLFAC